MMIFKLFCILSCYSDPAGDADLDLGDPDRDLAGEPDPDLEPDLALDPADPDLALEAAEPERALEPADADLALEPDLEPDLDLDPDFDLEPDLDLDPDFLLPDLD